jgi:hypothetical protein
MSQKTSQSLGWRKKRKVILRTQALPEKRIHRGEDEVF